MSIQMEMAYVTERRDFLHLGAMDNVLILDISDIISYY